MWPRTGSLNNCFGNKERLVAYFTYAMLTRSMPPEHRMVSFDDSPIMPTPVSVCAYHRCIMETSGYRQFFLDFIEMRFYIQTPVPRTQ